MLKRYKDDPILRKVFNIDYQKRELAPYPSDPDLIPEWKKTARNYYNDEPIRVYKARQVQYILNEAQKYKGYDFHFQHQFDFRGRVYTLGSGMNFQSWDLPRALIALPGCTGPYSKLVLDKIR